VGPGEVLELQGWRAEDIEFAVADIAVLLRAEIELDLGDIACDGAAGGGIEHFIAGGADGGWIIHGRAGDDDESIWVRDRGIGDVRQSDLRTSGVGPGAEDVC